MADQVPLGLFESAKCGELSFELLHTVLAENAQARGVRFLDPLRFHSLADGHQRNGVSGTADARSGPGDALTNLGDILSDGHAKIIGGEEKTLPRMNTDHADFQKQNRESLLLKGPLPQDAKRRKAQNLLRPSRPLR